MDQKRTTFMLALVLCLMAFAAATWNAVPVAAGPAAQVTVTPRPKLTSVPVELTVKSQPDVPRLHGTIFDWGKGNMPAGVTVILSGDGWQIPVETNESGEYTFLDIGNEVAFLSAVVPDDRGDLIPLTSDVPVRIDVNGELVVNLALHPKDLKPDPLIDLEILASSPEVELNETVSYAIRTVNNWEEGINQVIVADYLPEGLTYVSATASQGTVVFDRGLVWADLGPMASGDAATVTIVAKVDAEVEPDTTLVNRAAAYHSENAAVVAEASVKVVEQSKGVLPVTGLNSGLPLAVLFLAGLLYYTWRWRRAEA